MRAGENDDTRRSHDTGTTNMMKDGNDEPKVRLRKNLAICGDPILV